MLKANSAAPGHDSVEVNPLHCSPCQLNDLLGASTEDASQDPTFICRTVKAGQHLTRGGQDFESLYVVKAGFFKTMFTDDCGNEQVLAFPMKGDLIGTDGIGGDVHVNDVVALSDSSVVVIPFRRLDQLAQIAPRMDETLFRIISQQLIHDQLALTAMSALSAESRLARFLLRIGDQMKARGYSDHHFNLQMNRQEMGSYLGMKIETVSRTLTVLASKKMIAVNQREITILDRKALYDVSRQAASDGHKKTRSGAGAAAKAIRTKPRRPATPWSTLTDSTEQATR